MAKAKINMRSINQLVSKSGAWKKQAQIKMTKIFAAEKIKLLAMFENHPVSEEISNGPDASNNSGTLSSGNLFSFIGFQQGKNPVSEVSAFLAAAIKLNKTVKTNVSGKNKVTVSHTIKLPNSQTLQAISPMPWESGKSWVTSIESGISGFSNYMDKLSKKSRSGRGIQVKGKVRSAQYQPTPYLTPLIANFIRELKKPRRKA